MSSTAATAGGGIRPPRLPRWTRQEILILIEGKRAIEGRGKSRSSPGPAPEPKWAAVSAHCRRRGVDRGAVQCRKRWSNLAGDFKKIKEWESRRGEDQRESFWAMRNDARRERRLPGFFDREVFDALDGGAIPVAAAGEEEAVFDSGRTATEDGLFSDFEEEKETEEEEEDDDEEMAAAAAEVTPILVGCQKKFEVLQQESSDSGMPKEKQSAENPEKGPLPSQGQKRRRTSQEGYEDSGLQSKLIEVLDRNSRMLTAQLEAYNVNNQLERDLRKDQTESLLGVLSKVADALGRIADKL